MQTKIVNLSDETATLAYGATLAAATKSGAVIFLDGQLGAGKTTLTRGFLRGLGYEGKVKSPTYTLVEPYELVDRQIYHFDLFRLNSATELEYIGIKEYFSPESICLIEWPEKGQPLLPAADLTCHLSIEGEGRVMRLEAHSEAGALILMHLA